MRYPTSIALLSVSCLLAARGETSITTPLLGYVYEASSRTLRAIEGLPGASLLGNALRVEMEIGDALVSPDQSYALALTAEDRTPRVLLLHAGTVIPRVIDGPSRQVDRMVLSPSGACAALYAASEGILQIVTGLPDKAVIAREISSPAVDQMTVSDDGRLVLVSTLDPLAPVLLFDSTTQARTIALPGPVSALIFRPQSHDALITAAGGFTLVHDVSAGASYEEFADPSDPPVALGFSRHGDRFFAAYGDGTIRTYDVTSRAWSKVICHCVPTVFHPMNGDSLFRLTGSDRGPLFLLDGARNKVCS